MGNQKDKQVEETTQTAVITQIVAADNPSMYFDISTTNGFQQLHNEDNKDPKKPPNTRGGVVHQK